MSENRHPSLGWGQAFLWASLLPLSVLGAVSLVAAVTGGSDYCSTESKKKISDLSGFDFEISETDCDTLVKDASMSVVVSNHDGGERTLLFKFTPVYDTPLPDIAVDAQRSTILISVPEIVDIFSRRERWREFAIKYEIGTIDYPSTDASPAAK